MAYQVLRTKPRGYDDVKFMLELSNKTLAILSLLKNILLMHGISESLYWLCKLKKVKLRELSIFLKACYILRLDGKKYVKFRYIPNVRYLDAFFKEIEDVRHLKSVGDHLRFLQFLVHSDLWISEKYVKKYLRLYEHCVKHMGLMSYNHLSTFSQTQLVVDDSDEDVFDLICLNFERELSGSDMSHVRMLNNSLLCSKIRDLPTPFARVLKYFLNECRGSITPEFTVEALALLSKFYYRDTECLNKIGLCISGNIHNYSSSQLASCLNHFASLSYKHKPLIIAVSRYVADSSSKDLYSKFSIIASLSNLISKVKYNHISSINAVSATSNDGVSEIKKLIESDNNGFDDNAVGDSVRGSVINIVDNVDSGINLADFVFKRGKQKYLATDSKPIFTTDSFIQATNGSEGEMAERPRRSVLRKLRRSLPAVRESKDKEGELKYVPESTDIISVQSLSQYFSNFYSTYFNGEHPALRRLNNRRSMKQQLEKNKRGPEFEFSKCLSNVYYERKHDGNVNSSIRRIKYKMKYSGSRIVQPSTFYINQVKILKRCFLSPYVKFNADNKGWELNKGLESVVSKLVSGESLVGNNSLMYVDNKVLLKPYHQKYRFKHKTMKEFGKIMGLSNKVDGIIRYFTDNNLWSYTHKENSIVTSQPCVVDYIASVISSFSRLNYMPFSLYKSVLEVPIPRLVEVVRSDYRREGSNVNVSRFLNSVTKIVDSMRVTMMRDRSGTIVSRLEELLCSEGFVSLIAEYYAKEECVEYRLCCKLVDHMCRISFCKYLKDPAFKNGNTSNSSSSANDLHQTTRLGTIISTLCRLICIIDEKGFLDKTDFEEKSLVDIINNVVYVSWLSKLVQSKDEGFNGSIEGVSGEMSSKIYGILQKCVWKILESLERNECDTHLVQKYMDALNRYKELIKYDEEKISVVCEENGSRYLRSGEESASSVEDYYTSVVVNSAYNSSSHSQAGRNASSDQKLVTITHKGKEAPIRYVVHEIIRILAKHRRPLHTLELEKALRNIGFDGVNISTNKELFELLENNKMIDFNTTTKRLLYKNRFESVVSQETLLAYVVNNVGSSGLRVNLELLTNSASMVTWINELLKHRKIRAIRSNLSHAKGKKKCRYAGTQNQCSLYSSSKCQECYNNVDGLVLFPLGKEHFEQERYKLDHDIKSLWDSVTVPPNEDLLRDYNISQAVINFQPTQPEKRKKKESKGYGLKILFKLKMRKIYNTHLFTPEEMKDGITLNYQ
nr:hypothetical protein MACL_00003095 [Theileria orientalis]